ncbi:MAG TPA: DEAD/DEAH box helicase family protein, partial [Pyrinomonadaceae bacterium]|nr:DEAD/DEAH box helicase family protein [Pyrinomonadaceae bacterium]
MKDVPFQKKYIAKITDAALELLNDRYQEASTIVFQAPTGSGKTYMISQALSEIVKRSNDPLAFVWISVNSLHEQSLTNLSRYLEDEQLLECITVDEILDNELEEKQIVFFNWESLIKKNNVFRLDNERDWNLKTVAENTREQGRRIVLIVDESHRTASAERAREVVAEIGPALTIEMTATPLQIAGSLLKVPLHEVIDAGMIKREVIINPYIKGSAMGNDSELIDTALERRKKLKGFYENLGSEINPLLLVQVPNARPGRSSNPEDYITELLADRGYTVKNGRLAIWLSEKKENRDDIELPNSPVDVLIFKEAIALGWDCPRAAILYLDREWSSERISFNIQTLGRIMRMPEQMHY